MSTIFDTATQKQIEKFDEFKQELLDWKNQHAREYSDFVKCMNSDDPAVMVGLGHLVGILCPQVFTALADCWNDDTLSSRDWLQRISEKVSLSEILGDGLFDSEELAPEEMTEKTMDDDMAEIQDLTEENGSIKEYGMRYFKEMCGDRPIPDGLEDALSDIFDKLQSTSDRFTSGAPVDHTTINDSMQNINGVLNKVMQNEYLAPFFQDIASWTEKIKLKDPDNLIPFLLIWMIHGRAFEKVVMTLNDQAARTEYPQNLIVLDQAVDAVRISLEKGYRTKEQWEEFLDIMPTLHPHIVKKVKALVSTLENPSSTDVPKSTSGRRKGREGTLSQFLTCKHSDKVIKTIEDYIKKNPKADDIALVAIALRKLELIPDLTLDSETSQAIYKEFADRINDLKKEGSIRKSIGSLSSRSVRTLKDGTKTEVYGYEEAPFDKHLESLMTKIKKTIS